MNQSRTDQGSSILFYLLSQIKLKEKKAFVKSAENVVESVKIRTSNSINIS